jgi:general stress protein 26
LVLGGASARHDPADRTSWLIGRVASARRVAPFAGTDQLTCIRGNREMNQPIPDEAATDEASRQAIWGHIKAIGTCMMVTPLGDTVHARPMHAIARPDQNAIWFFVDRESHGVEEAKQEPSACLTFADVKDNVYVSVSGRLSRVQDRAVINELWDEAAGGYFPAGPADPRVLLLRFEPETGDYWSAPSSPIVLAIKFLGAKLLGERPELGTRGSARLSR